MRICTCERADDLIALQDRRYYVKDRDQTLEQFIQEHPIDTLHSSRESLVNCHTHLDDPTDKVR